MKKLIILLSITLISLSNFGQNIAGSWMGVLKVQGMELKIVFNIENSDNKLSATMDSPDQGAKGIPVSNITFIDNKLKIEIDKANITYEGTYQSRDSIIGTFNQRGLSLPLNLAPVDPTNIETRKSQEPVPPYPYQSENITFENQPDKVTLAGTLTYPKKGQNFPAVILISGSGPQNRDEELLGHKPFLVLSDYLTRHGFAVLRYDDRGTAESTGDFKSATTWDLANDAKAAVEYLKSRKEIDSKNIGLIGHSEGGMIAPMVAAAMPEVKFIVLLAGPGIWCADLLLKQQELIGKASGMSQIDLEHTHEVNKGAFDLIINNKNPKALQGELSSYLKNELEKYPELNTNPNMDIESLIKAETEQLLSPWMMYFIRYNPEPTLKKVHCAVLALNGEKDLQVEPKADLQGIENALKEGGNPNFKTVELQGLNHLFQECKTGLPAEYSSIDQTISPKALKIISDWMLDTIK